MAISTAIQPSNSLPSAYWNTSKNEEADSRVFGANNNKPFGGFGATTGTTGGCKYKFYLLISSYRLIHHTDFAHIVIFINNCILFWPKINITEINQKYEYK